MNGQNLSPDMYRSAVDSATNHIVITDSEGVILFANKVAQDITGFSFAEMEGNTPRLWGRQMPIEFYEYLWKTIKTEQKPFKGELTNKRKNGEIYIAIASISPIFSANNTLLGFIGIEEDITEIRRTQKALEAKTAELDVINKLMVGREMKMIELKEKLKKYEKT